MRAILKRAEQAYHDAWLQPRDAFRHGSGPIIYLLPGAVKVETDQVDLGDIVGTRSACGTKLHVDGNTHDLLRVRGPVPEDIVITCDRTSPHVDVPAFLAQCALDTGIEPERMLIYLPTSGSIEVHVAPSMAWVDPLVRRSDLDCACVQQFIMKYNIGAVNPDTMQALFGDRHYTQVEGGTARALLPFLARVDVFIDSTARVLHARYNNTVNDVLARLSGPLYLHGVQLEPSDAPLWMLTPLAHGRIYLYTKPVATRVRALPAFVPCRNSPTGNALSTIPAARRVPAVVTQAHLMALTCGEPMTISRAQCIYRALTNRTDETALVETLVGMAMPQQDMVMRESLRAQLSFPVREAFRAYVTLST